MMKLSPIIVFRWLCSRVGKKSGGHFSWFWKCQKQIFNSQGLTLSQTLTTQH